MTIQVCNWKEPCPMWVCWLHAMTNGRVAGDLRCDNVYVISLWRNRCIFVISYRWFIKSSVWDNPYICACHPYELAIVYLFHCSDVIWTPSRLITGNTTIYSRAPAWQQRKPQSSTYCPFVRGIHRWLVDSLHKGQETFPLHYQFQVIWTS